MIKVAHSVCDIAGATLHKRARDLAAVNMSVTCIEEVGRGTRVGMGLTDSPRQVDDSCFLLLICQCLCIYYYCLALAYNYMQQTV
jgi:hypothetical protein